MLDYKGKYRISEREPLNIFIYFTQTNVSMIFI